MNQINYIEVGSNLYEVAGSGGLYDAVFKINSNGSVTVVEGSFALCAAKISNNDFINILCYKESGNDIYIGNSTQYITNSNNTYIYIYFTNSVSVLGGTNAYLNWTSSAASIVNPT